MKDVGMRIRVEPELREQFINLCHENNLPAAQVLRSFMRDFVQSSKSGNFQKKSRNKQLISHSSPLVLSKKVR
jgi:hypothetical protein